MRNRFEDIILKTLLVVVTLAALFVITILVACAINGNTFGEQLTAWFGKAALPTEEESETMVEALFSLLGK